MSVGNFNHFKVQKVRRAAGTTTAAAAVVGSLVASPEVSGLVVRRRGGGGFISRARKCVTQWPFRPSTKEVPTQGPSDSGDVQPKQALNPVEVEQSFARVEHCDEGTSISSFMKKHGKNSPKAEDRLIPKDRQVLALKWIHDLAEACKSMREAGGSHRGMEPDNLLLDSGRNLKASDFGLALDVGSRWEHITAGHKFNLGRDATGYTVHLPKLPPTRKMVEDLDHQGAIYEHQGAILEAHSEIFQLFMTAFDILYWAAVGVPVHAALIQILSKIKQEEDVAIATVTKMIFNYGFYHSRAGQVWTELRNASDMDANWTKVVTSLGQQFHDLVLGMVKVNAESNKINDEVKTEQIKKAETILDAIIEATK